MHYLSKFILS